MRAAVIGAGGAIGSAFVASLAADPRFEVVHALSRNPAQPQAAKVSAHAIDITDEASVAAAATAFADPLDLVLIATGMLHEGGQAPERALRQIEPEWLARSFTVNAIGPAIVLKHFVPLLPRSGRAIVAALSARVGSISDNRLGGWYGYRASKAALNMIVRCAAIEIARTRPDTICVSLHPGTVDSALSRPFQDRVPSGKLFNPGQSAAYLLAVLDRLEPKDSGLCFAWDESVVEP